MKWIHFLKRIRRNIHMQVYKNVLGIKVNLLHSVYTWWSQIKFKQSEDNNFDTDILKVANELHEKGFVKLEPFLSPDMIKKMSQRSDELYSQPERVVSTHKEDGLIRLKNSLIEIPEYEIVLQDKRLQKIITAYYKSYFKVFSCDAYRTIPCNEPPKSTFSVLWHLDNVPKDTLKVMTYLTDVTKERGAISLVPKDVSGNLVKRGFWDRFKAESFMGEIEKNLAVIEGKAGTVILFAAQHCIHKATNPKFAYRDVFTFLLYPSTKKSTAFTPKDREKVSYNFGYPTNPFTEKPLRYGEE